MNIKELDNQYVMATYGRFPVAIVSGKGSLLYDDEGKEYIDMGSGIAVNIFGACDESWAKAVSEQLFRVQHTSNLYYTEPCAKLAQLLCQKTGMKKVFFGNSGAEANECMIKAARRWSHEKYGDGRYTIITLKNSFHGRTITTLAATGQDKMHTDFMPFTEGFVYADPEVPGSVRKLAEENNCCAVMIEVVQGEGGVNTLSQAFIDEIKEVAASKDLLLLVDEVQTGNGRTGAMYAYMNVGLQPDIISTAKGLGGGLPIGATLFSEKTQNALVSGTHGSTFGGNPACAAGACNIVERIDEELLAGVRERSEYIIRELTGAEGVKSVTGMGLMLGIDTVKPAAEVVAACREKGVLVLTAKTKVRLLPPLNIPMEQLKKAVTVIKEVLK
ncbi:MAG: acetylornithine/succinylornithine family transaminase [Clostridia bacterium]|nr:acetylornithine/succinylornithine family transaminase [Clostridia bacterium]